METKHWVSVTVLVILWLAESYRPFFANFTDTRERLRHDVRNLAWGAVNAALGAAALALAFVQLDAWSEKQQQGILRQFALPDWLALVLAVVLLDFWTYWWHRLNHALPFLWRFHRTHHSDVAMDVSSGVRFHTSEIFFSWVMRLAVLPALGVSLVQLATYEALLLPVVLFHHSNLKLPRWLDFGLLAIVVTPAMHRVHHSREVTETNSNYGSLLPWWDWLFGSLRLRRDVENITYGLDEFGDPRWQTLRGMLRTPLGDAGLATETSEDTGGLRIIRRQEQVCAVPAVRPPTSRHAETALRSFRPTTQEQR